MRGAGAGTPPAGGGDSRPQAQPCSTRDRGANPDAGWRSAFPFAAAPRASGRYRAGEEHPPGTGRPPGGFSYRETFSPPGMWNKLQRFDFCLCMSTPVSAALRLFW